MIQLYANVLLLFLKLRLCSHKIAINYLLSLFFHVVYSFISNHFFVCFSYIIMYTLNVASAIKKMTVIKLRDFIFETTIQYSHCMNRSEQNCSTSFFTRVCNVNLSWYLYKKSAAFRLAEVGFLDWILTLFYLGYSR